MKHQSKKASLIEALVSNTIGFFLTVIAALIVNPHQPFIDNLLFSTFLLVLHIFRSYWVRRGFNYYTAKRAKAEKARKRKLKRDSKRRGGKNTIDGTHLVREIDESKVEQRSRTPINT